MHCHCGTNNRAPRWTFTDPCKPEVRPGAREESASPAWLAAPAMNARDSTKVEAYLSKCNRRNAIFNFVLAKLSQQHTNILANETDTLSFVGQIKNLEKRAFGINSRGDTKRERPFRYIRYQQNKTKLGYSIIML